MVTALKKNLYFPAASYFRYFAKRRLRRWNPTVVVITGSSGKTTTLHLIESQVGSRAAYSHKANSSFGIPFDILGIKRETFFLKEWPGLYLKAITPKPDIPSQNIYIVEADCDRPYEGTFLSQLLKPAITIWMNSSRTHSAQFDSLVQQGRYKTIEEAVATEFSAFAQATTSHIIYNADSSVIRSCIPKTDDVRRSPITSSLLQSWNIISGKDNFHTRFVINAREYTFPFLLPQNVWYSIAATIQLCEDLSIPVDDTFPGFHIPPGRSSLLSGKKGIQILDSSYNANYDSMAQIIELFDAIPTKRSRWIVLADMIEQGRGESQEHIRLAEFVSSRTGYDRIILMGPRMMRYAAPILKKQSKASLSVYDTPREVLDELEKTISGKEMILFKGGRFLEGVIEHVLANPDDVSLLCRQEASWKKIRKEWGL